MATCFLAFSLSITIAGVSARSIATPLSLAISRIFTFILDGAPLSAAANSSSASGVSVFGCNPSVASDMPDSGKFDPTASVLGGVTPVVLVVAICFGACPTTDLPNSKLD